MSKQLATLGNWSIEDIETMKHTLASGTNDSQFQLFLRTAHASGLNPFLNHIYAIVYQGKMSLQIGIEGIAYLAKQAPGYKGYDAQIVCENDEFRAKKSTVYNEKTGEREDEWTIVTHEIGFPRGKIIGAYAIAYRDGFPPFTVLMDWEEVEHFQQSSIPNQKTMWSKYTADMFKKHVAKRALKGQFGIDINEDDIVGSGTPIESYERKNITEEVNASSVGQQEQHQPQKQQTPPPAGESEADQIKKARAEMKRKFTQLGISDPAAMEQYIAENAKIKGDKPTLAEYKGLLKIMDLHISEMQSQQSDDDELPL